MRKAILALLAAGAIAGLSTTSAQAWGGCGWGGHPTPWGCRPNHHHYWGGPVYFGGPAYGWGWGHHWHHRHWRHYW